MKSLTFILLASFIGMSASYADDHCSKMGDKSAKVVLPGMDWGGYTSATPTRQKFGKPFYMATRLNHCLKGERLVPTADRVMISIFQVIHEDGETNEIELMSVVKELEGDEDHFLTIPHPDDRYEDSLTGKRNNSWRFQTKSAVASENGAHYFFIRTLTFAGGIKLHQSPIFQINLER